MGREPELLHRLRELAKNVQHRGMVARMSVTPSEARELVDFVDGNRPDVEPSEMPEITRRLDELERRVESFGVRGSD